MKTIKKIALLSASALVVAQLSGCSAIQTEINHGSLKTQSKMSDTIFLDPIPDKEKTIYVQVHDTSSEKIDLKAEIIKDLEDQGWKVTKDLGKAHNMVQVNVLQAGEAPNVQSVWQSMGNGYGNVLLGGFTGVAAGLATGSTGAGLAVGGITAAAGWLSDSLVKDVVYSMITDVQVSVKTDGKVTQTTHSKLSQGTESKTVQTYNQKTNWLRYKTRVASVADKVNLKFEEAKPVLVKQVSKEISGIFG
ncbi:complement resistance protein TraT [Piscirickettsia salmonis]|uniref:complement resistance protein TraT n=1 Tax=Piscirickettsia salmonis TaxID=1238 RepID=UPI0006BCA5E3|nr:complement resistance protein TraT [Piscirickettsia salmonis]ALA26653.1 conjugal transfer protein TraT [Piscirickettsia salmonis]APS45866.1 hypothetical protein AVI48_15650 [Piscirickettsia salmonis]APS49251.1 hypothetical protein AVI49_16475 [Piscirickettsia salmonis]QGO82362.1 Lipoprotein YlpA precursor [Piscirickettsia salmonis]QGP24191.1 Lipoprotein YlpA precursor [Piscirickettsia salmonis]